MSNQPINTLQEANYRVWTNKRKIQSLKVKSGNKLLFWKIAVKYGDNYAEQFKKSILSEIFLLENDNSNLTEMIIPGMQREVIDRELSRRFKVYESPKIKKYLDKVSLIKKG